MEFSKTTLKNGLRVVCTPIPSMESVAIEVLVGAGTRHEEKRVNGLAHFLEHMVFKGTRRYPSAQKISSAVDAIGAEINANTGKERTAYYIKAWERHIKLAFDILSDFVREPLLKPRDIEKEKGVILEEIAMYEDLPMQKAPYLFEELLYPDSPLGWEVLGTRESIPVVRREDFEAYRAKYYYPQNMVLSVAGRFDKDKVLELADKYFGNLTQNSPREAGRAQLKAQNYKLKLKTRENPSGKPEVKLVNKQTEQAHLVLGVRGYPRAHPDRYKEAVLATVLGGGMSSRLFTEIREKRGLAYYVKTSVEHYQEAGYLATRAGIRLGKVEEAIKVVLAEYDKAKSRKHKAKITERELQKAKEYLKGKLALGLEDTHEVADFFGDQEIGERRIRTIEEIIKGVDRVTVQDLQKLAGVFFQNSRLNLAIIGPYNDKAKFQKLLKL